MNNQIARDSLNYLKDQSVFHCCDEICNSVFNDERFFTWTASSTFGKHHYGIHGLVIHTTEVVKLCQMNNLFYNNSIHHRKVFLAALFHDVGKMWDYEPLFHDKDINEQTTWTNAFHKTDIYHITRSVLVWQKAAENHLPQEEIDEVIHAILAHHGRPEWGSPVTPNSRLAYLLHLCDGISARMTDCGK